MAIVSVSTRNNATISILFDSPEVPLQCNDRLAQMGEALHCHFEAILVAARGVSLLSVSIFDFYLQREMSDYSYDIVALPVNEQ